MAENKTTHIILLSNNKLHKWFKWNVQHLIMYQHNTQNHILRDKSLAEKAKR